MFGIKIKYLSNEYQDIDDEELIDNCLHNFCFNLKNNYFIFECLYEQIYNGFLKTNKLIPENIIDGIKSLKKGTEQLKNLISI